MFNFCLQSVNLERPLLRVSTKLLPKQARLPSPEKELLHLSLTLKTYGLATHTSLQDFPNPALAPHCQGQQDLAVKSTHRLCNHTDMGSSPGSFSPTWVTFRGHFPSLGLNFSSLRDAKEVPLCLGCIRINEKMPAPASLLNHIY